jgi:hypothetical protein
MSAAESVRLTWLSEKLVDDSLALALASGSVLSWLLITVQAGFLNALIREFGFGRTSFR